jgi:hypothetical protein
MVSGAIARQSAGADWMQRKTRKAHIATSPSISAILAGAVYLRSDAAATTGRFEELRGDVLPGLELGD